MTAPARAPTNFAKSRRAPSTVTPERWVAWRTVLRSFEDGAFTDRVFTTEAEKQGLDPRARSLAQYLAYGTVRSAKTLDHVIAVAGKRPLAKIQPEIIAALRIGAFSLLGDSNTPSHAAVNESVEIVRAALGERPVPFANAVLRRIQVDGQTTLAKLDPENPDDLPTLLSMPEWIVTAMVEALGRDDGLAALRAQNAGHVLAAWGTNTVRAPSFRINTLRADIALFDSEAAEAGVSLTPPGHGFSDLEPALRELEGPSTPLAPSIDAGLLVAQSAGSASIPALLDIQPDDRILDLCAAPGAKTSQIAALLAQVGGSDTGAGIVAVELHEHRARQLRELLDRTGATKTAIVIGDARSADLPVQLFDRILLDAPCSGLGVLGSRPDSRWRRSQDDVQSLGVLQRELLTRAVSLLAPEGVLVYSSCTLTPEENEDQVRWACAELGLRINSLPPPVPAALRFGIDDGEALRTLPQRDGTDGFFAVRMMHDH